MGKTINFYGKQLNCYKANLHAHTSASDGCYSHAEICRVYEEENYDILAVTDHRLICTPERNFKSAMQLITAMEFHPSGPRGILLHLLALNVPDNFKNPSDLPYQDAIKAVRDAGGECILAHPYWSGLNYLDIMEITDIIGIEVYNTSARRIGKAYNMQIWDELLDQRMILHAIAVDDTHRPRDLFRGWTMVCTREKSINAVMTALKEGSYYSTQGPEIYSLEFRDQTFSIECSPCSEVILISNRDVGVCGAAPDLNAKTADDLRCSKLQEITSFSSPIPARENLSYIRCQITDKNGKMAWTNPLNLLAGEK